MRSGTTAHPLQHRGAWPRGRARACRRRRTRLLVLLHVLVVGERQALQHDQQADQVPDHAAGLAAHQLGHVGVVLLRHDRAAGGEGVGHARRSRTAASTRAPAPRPGATGARPQIAAAARYSSAKSRSETASIELALGRSKPSSAAVIRRSIGKLVPASAAAPSGNSLRRAPRVGEARAVAPQHLDVGQQVVAEGHRLRRLQVGEARHHGGGVPLRELDQHAPAARAGGRPPARSRRAARGGSRSRPGRCASARCAAGCPARRPARSGAPRC